MLTTFKGISDTSGRAHPQLARTGAVLSFYRFEYNQKGKQGNLYIKLLFFRMELFLLGRGRNGVGARVGFDIFRRESESEIEALEIRRLRSPDQKRKEENGRHDIL